MISTIRLAGPDDLESLLALDRACFSRPWTAEQWRAELDPPAPLRPLVVLATGVESALGFACAPMLPPVCELRRIGVIPEARHAGLGRDLLARVIDHAVELGCHHVELEVAADNLAAIALYQRGGFHTVGRRPGYYLDPPTDAWLMTLDLGPHPSRRLASASK